MHASIWKFSGDPDALLASYDALMSEVGVAGLQLHVCLRAEDGIVMIDAGPSKAAVEALVASAAFRELCERNGLPVPDRIDDFPVHVAYAGGAMLHGEGAPPIRVDPLA